jgi:hypothetical protein
MLVEHPPAQSWSPVAVTILRWCLVATLVEGGSVLITAAVRGDWFRARENLTMFSVIWPLVLLGIVAPMARLAALGRRRAGATVLTSLLVSLIAAGPMHALLQGFVGFAITLPLAAALHFATARPARPTPFICHHCGYDLRGLPVSADGRRCPECITIAALVAHKRN